MHMVCTLSRDMMRDVVAFSLTESIRLLYSFHGTSLLNLPHMQPSNESLLCRHIFWTRSGFLAPHGHSLAIGEWKLEFGSKLKEG